MVVQSLGKIAEDVEKYPEYDGHKFITILNDKTNQLEGFIAIHRKNKEVPSFGATRFWSYASKEMALRDALRLSKMMSYKAALAGLPCGGAKAVIIKPKKLKDKNKVLKAYAEQLKYLDKQFVTGTDVGLTQEDIEFMKKTADNLVGITGNPTKYTGESLEIGIRACLEYKFNSDDIGGRVFAIQGLGKIGGELLSRIYGKVSEIFVADTDESVLEGVKKKYPKVKIVDPEEIHKQKVDVFSPCALSHSINSKTINDLNCDIVAGAANNQLENDEMGDLLDKLGMLYAPDYVINSGGLIAVYDEHQNGSGNSGLAEKIKNVKQIITDILRESTEKGTPTHRIANARAEAVFNKYE